MNGPCKFKEAWGTHNGFVEPVAPFEDVEIPRFDDTVHVFSDSDASSCGSDCAIESSGLTFVKRRNSSMGRSTPKVETPVSFVSAGRSGIPLQLGSKGGDKTNPLPFSLPFQDSTGGSKGNNVRLQTHFKTNVERVCQEGATDQKNIKEKDRFEE